MVVEEVDLWRMIRPETEGEVEEVPGRFIGSLEELLRRDVLNFFERRSRASWLKCDGGRCSPTFSVSLFRPTWRSALSAFLSVLFSSTAGSKPQSSPSLKL